MSSWIDRQDDRLRSGASLSFQRLATDEDREVYPDCIAAVVLHDAGSARRCYVLADGTVKRHPIDGGDVLPWLYDVQAQTTRRRLTDEEYDAIIDPARRECSCIVDEAREAFDREMANVSVTSPSYFVRACEATVRRDQIVDAANARFAEQRRAAGER